MTSIASLPNLGARSQQMLAAAGIDSAEQLEALGAVQAFIAVRHAGQPASLNLLWALEGALTRRPWQQVARDDRLRLLTEIETLGCVP